MRASAPAGSEWATRPVGDEDGSPFVCPAASPTASSAAVRTRVGGTRPLACGAFHHLAGTPDLHSGKWDRFSWFGFRRVLKRPDRSGLQPLAGLATVEMSNQNEIIGDMEALLIAALGCPSNLNKMSFRQAREWTQVRDEEAEAYLEKLAR